MAIYFADHAAPSAGTVVMPTGDTRVRVRRLLVTTAANGVVRLKQNPGPQEVLLTPSLQARAAGPPMDLSFTREYPQTEVEASLGYVTEIDGPHSIWIEYELVR